MAINELPDGREVVDGRACCSVRKVRPGTLHMTLSGHLRTPFYDGVISVLDAELRRGKSLRIYVDAWHFESYETAFRTVWTEWLKKSKPQLQTWPFLVRSKIVKMGIQVVNLATGGILHPVATRLEFSRMMSEDGVPPHFSVPPHPSLPSSK